MMKPFINPINSAQLTALHLFNKEKHLNDNFRKENPVTFISVIINLDGKLSSSLSPN